MHLMFGLLWLADPSTLCAQPPRDSLVYIVQLASGDRMRGNLVGHTDSTLIVATEYGTITLRKELIARFLLADGPQLKGPHHFFMPTASPNGPGGFLSNYELGFFYGGLGLGHGATITAGMSTLPGIPIARQIFHAGIKITVERSPEYDAAVGAAYTFLTTDFPYAHIYGVVTMPVGSGRYSAMIFYKVSGDNEAPISLQAFNFDSTRFTVFYNSSLGAALGFDAPAFGREDVRWIGEIWNNDLSRPQNTVSTVGVRFLNDRFSADFGLALFTAPFIVPVTRFLYRWY